jgi:lipid-A-disaccharide synthase
MKIALVAGEVSGDILGARLIKALKVHFPDAQFEGIAGPEMQAAGCVSLHDMERLSVMGFAEVIGRLWELLGIRKSLIQRWTENPPDIMIGIDAPDFNLLLERKLHANGVRVAHYVSPSIWAWRQGRVKKFVGKLDLMLALFPFEKAFYEAHKVPVAFVGHPLADEIPLHNDALAARKALNLPESVRLLAVLPGSRSGEIQRLGPHFLQAVATLHQNHPDWQFVTPLVNDRIAAKFKALHQQYAPEVPIHFIDGQSRTVMAASDQILMASGTAVLEGMLVGRPMVAAYAVAALTGWIITQLGMIKSPYYTLPNNLANECLVPEVMQEKLSPQALVDAVEAQFAETAEQAAYREQRFTDIHKTLKQDASRQAALAIQQLIGRAA